MDLNMTSVRWEGGFSPDFPLSVTGTLSDFSPGLRRTNISYGVSVSIPTREAFKLMTVGDLEAAMLAQLEIDYPGHQD
jgi:hypothetical protein